MLLNRLRIPRLRWRLSTLFLLLTALCGWLGFHANRHYRQQPIVEKLTSRGLQVLYEDQITWIAGEYPSAPALAEPANHLETVLWSVGIPQTPASNFFRKAVVVNAGSDSSRTDDNVRLACELPQLHALFVRQAWEDADCVMLTPAHLSDHAFDALLRRPELRALDLSLTIASKSDYQKLAGLPRLEFLNLADTDVDDDVVAALAGIPALKTLNLDRTRVTDKCIEALARMPNLDLAALTGTQVSKPEMERQFSGWQVHGAGYEFGQHLFAYRNSVTGTPTEP